MHQKLTSSRAPNLACRAGRVKDRSTLLRSSSSRRVTVPNSRPV